MLNLYSDGGHIRFMINTNT